MSKYTNYDEKELAQIFDRETKEVGADVIAGLLHMHCGKPLKDLHVLDAGCGTGRYSEALIDLGVGKISLLDASPGMLKVAAEKLKAAIEKNMIDKITEAILPNLPYEEGTFDAVMYSYVLQDLDKPGDQNKFNLIENVLHKTKKILRTKGVLVITTALPTSVKESCWFTQFYQPVTNKLASIFPSTNEWFDMFAKSRFRCVSAMNFLFSEKVNHFDPEGPLKEDWWLATFVGPSANDQEKIVLDETIKRLKEQGQLKSFMDEHDHTLERGYSTLFVCVSI